MHEYLFHNILARREQLGTMEIISATYTIKSNYQNLSIKEKQIADYILAHPHESINPSIEELAGNIGISEATLVRFVRKLGFSGYQKFRIALARESVTNAQQVFEVEVSDKEDAVDLVFSHTIKVLQETYKLVNKQLVKEVAGLITNGTSLYLFGLGGSNISARDAFHKFIRTGLSCNFAEDFHMQLMLASQAKKTDVAILFSHMGANYDILSIAEELKSHQCKLIVFTSYSKSTLARMADTVLEVCPLNSDVVAEAFSANIAASTYINALYVEIMQLRDKQGLECLNNMREAIAKRRI